jgi:hypothetical protein
MKLRRRPSASAKAPVGTSKRKATAKYTARTLLISNWLRPRAEEERIHAAEESAGQRVDEPYSVIAADDAALGEL